MISVIVSIVLLLIATAVIILVYRMKYGNTLNRQGSKNRSLELKLNVDVSQDPSGASLIQRTPTLDGPKFNPHTYLKQQITL